MPVITPTCLENSCLIRLGISTLPTEMDNPRINVPRNSPTPPNNERNIIPEVRKISDQSSTNLVPNFRAKRGAKGENHAKANNGRVVIIPANVFEICKLPRI